jgi:hypothetical protein
MEFGKEIQPNYNKVTTTTEKRIWDRVGDYYVKCTSPLRRFTDLVVQFAIADKIDGKEIQVLEFENTKTPDMMAVAKERRLADELVKQKYLDAESVEFFKVAKYVYFTSKYNLLVWYDSKDSEITLRYKNDIWT